MKRIIFKKLVVTLVITLLYINIGIQGMKGSKSKESYEKEEEDEWEDWEDEDEQNGIRKKGNTWNDLTPEELSAIKLYLFSQSVASFTQDHLADKELKPSDVLEKLQEGLLKMTTTETDQCPYGHSKCTKTFVCFDGYQCNICERYGGSTKGWYVYRCNDCCTDKNKKMCGECFKITKFGPKTREAMKRYLHEKTGKEYRDLTILKDFVEYINELNWLQGGALKYYETIEKNGADFDFSQLEKIKIVYTGQEYKFWQKIPANSRQSMKMTIGYSNDNKKSIEKTTSERYTWSFKAGPKNMGINGEMMSETGIDNIRSIVTSFTCLTEIEQEYPVLDVERVIYIMTYYGYIEKNGEKIEYMNYNEKKIETGDNEKLINELKKKFEALTDSVTDKNIEIATLTTNVNTKDVEIQSLKTNVNNLTNNVNNKNIEIANFTNKVNKIRTISHNIRVRHDGVCCHGGRFGCCSDLCSHGRVCCHGGRNGLHEEIASLEDALQ